MLKTQGSILHLWHLFVYTGEHAFFKILSWVISCLLLEESPTFFAPTSPGSIALFLSMCYESPCCQTPLENVDEPGTVFSQHNLLLVQKSSLLVSCFLLACSNCPHSSPQSYRGSSLMQFSCYMMKIFFFPPSIYQTKWPSQKVFLRLMIYLIFFFFKLYHR